MEKVLYEYDDFEEAVIAHFEGDNTVIGTGFDREDAYEDLLINKINS